MEMSTAERPPLDPPRGGNAGELGWLGYRTRVHLHTHPKVIAEEMDVLNWNGLEKKYTRDVRDR